MSAPGRTHQAGTFFITFVCAERRRLFQRAANAQLLLHHLQQHRRTEYLLHAFVIMPEHVHLLLTPTTTLERSMQMIKGGFSHKYHQANGNSNPVWQRGFTDHRVRDRRDYTARKKYLEHNPVARGLCTVTEAYRWSSAYKPTSAAEAEPQSKSIGTAEAVPFLQR